MSFLDGVNIIIADAVIDEVAMQLFDDWYNARLEDGELYADYRLLLLVDNDYLNRKFNEHYNLKPGDEYYMPWDKEA